MTLRYTLGQAGPVTLRICDVSGRAVRTLVDEAQAIGDYEAVWDGRDDRGVPAGSGAYSALLEAPGCKAAEKVVLIR